MGSTAVILGLLLLITVIADALQTVIVARHARSLPRMTRLFYQLTWVPFAALAQYIRPGRRREHYLGLYGPLSLLMLLGLWALGLIVSFALLRWAAAPRFEISPSDLLDAIYSSAQTFFTLGSGEPQYPLAKFLLVAEAGLGFTFLGLVIGYLPVLYQSYSSRELRILVLDARAGSPPSAFEFLSRVGTDPNRLEQRLANWEEWALDLLQCHLSYPMLAYYRSQHPNQSWLSALTTIVDVSAVVMVSATDELKRQAEFTFAAGPHALAHTASIFHRQPSASYENRLDAREFSRLCAAISEGHAPLRADGISEAALQTIRTTYEPHAIALGRYFMMAVPSFVPETASSANWQAQSWDA